MSHEQESTSGNGNVRQSFPDSEVQPRAKRRTFTAEYKLRMLNEAAACRVGLDRRDDLEKIGANHEQRVLQAERTDIRIAITDLDAEDVVNVESDDVAKFPAASADFTR